MPIGKRKPLVEVRLRIPEDLKQQLDREAQKRDDRSLSAEIADRLRKSFLLDETTRHDDRHADEVPDVDY
jgi:hypothetical protein